MVLKYFMNHIFPLSIRVVQTSEVYLYVINPFKRAITSAIINCLRILASLVVCAYNPSHVCSRPLWWTWLAESCSVVLSEPRIQISFRERIMILRSVYCVVFSLLAISVYVRVAEEENLQYGWIGEVCDNNAEGSRLQLDVRLNLVIGTWEVHVELM